jgi:hypothetical protein
MEFSLKSKKVQQLYSCNFPCKIAAIITGSVFITRNLLATNKITNTLCQINVLIIFKFKFILLTLLWLLLFPMLNLSKHPERLIDSYRRYLCHRHLRVVVFLCCRLCRLFARRTITSSMTLKSSVDNKSPFLNPCRISIVSVALVRRINFVGKR